MPNLPQEWKASLVAIPEQERGRVEGLLVRGATAPLPAEREIGPFLLFMLGDTVEDVANKTGIPKDVMYLTYIKYNWEKKREELARSGNAMVIGALQKQLVNHLLVATQMSVLSQVGKVMSGEIPPEKCPLIPRSLHGLKTLLEIVTQMNALVPQDANQPKSQTVIQAQNVQVNQSITPEGAPQPENQTIEVRRRAFLEQMEKEESGK